MTWNPTKDDCFPIVGEMCIVFDYILYDGPSTTTLGSSVLWRLACTQRLTATTVPHSMSCCVMISSCVPRMSMPFRELTTAGEYSCVIGIIAVSSAVGVACDSVYPPGISELPSPLKTTIRGQTDCADRSISLLWTIQQDVPAKGDVEINQFVPLFACRQSDMSPPHVATANVFEDVPDVANDTHFTKPVEKRCRRNKTSRQPQQQS